MLRLSGSSKQDSSQCTPNLLPCRIHHDGPVDASPRYWNPERSKGRNSIILSKGTLADRISHTADDGPEAYFRGRKLKGKIVKLPEGYEGMIVQKSGKEQRLVQNVEQQKVDEEAGREENEEELGRLSKIGSFEEVIIWGHDSCVPTDDLFVKGIEEWIGFAEMMHEPGKSPGQ
ncbi:hypothetical protein ACLMJK_003374 [Lecanora helva]